MKISEKNTQNTINGGERDRKEMEENYYLFNILYIFLYCLEISIPVSMYFLP